MQADDTARIINYVKSMSLSQLINAPSKEQLVVELNIQNPVVADALNYWIGLRRTRIIHTKLA